MMKQSEIFLRFIFFFLSIQIIIYSQQRNTHYPDYYKLSKVKIYIENKSDILLLNKYGVLTDSYVMKNNYLETFLDSTQLNILRSLRYNYEILIDDLTKDFLERNLKFIQKDKLNKKSNNTLFSYGSMGGFYTYNEVVKQLDTMRLIYPNLISVKDSIGRSIEGRTIWAVKISDNPDIDENEPQIFYNSLIHAREPEGMMSLIYFMDYLLENYGSDPEVTYLINNRELYFVPVINPDGYIYNEEMSPNGGGTWRKNRRDNGNGVFGVDLNRNFGYKWGYGNSGSSSDPYNNDYRGESPFSEPETQAIKDFCENHDFKIAVDNHTYGNFVVPPWNYDNTSTSDSTIFNNIIAIANAVNGYEKYWPYPANGEASDWMYGERETKNKIIAVTPEIGDHFWPTADQIIPIAEENLYTNLVYAWGPGINQDCSYVPVVKLDKSYLNPAGDILSFHFHEKKLDNAPCKLSAQIIDENDSIIDKIEINNLSESYDDNLVLNLRNEAFYRFRIEQLGTEIPFKFYSQSSKFTTAGPLVVDSVKITKILNGFASVRLFIKNVGKIKSIENVAVILTSKDSSVSNIYPQGLQLGDILPGERKEPERTSSITYNSDHFSGEFNLEFEISSGGTVYWTDSTKSIITDINNDDVTPATFSLQQNYPNPFNPVTTIEYSVPINNKVKLCVYDLLGREVKVLVDGYQAKGNYEVNFDASNLSSGIYFYQLVSSGFINTKKMILLK